VARPRLLRRLAGSWKVAVLSAPAGYGKTTLAVQATARREALWCRIHQEDGDPAHLLRTICIAASGLRTAAGRRVAELLVSFRDMDRDGGLLTAALLRALEPERGTRILVLDDLHRVADGRASLQWLRRFIEESGPRVRFLITARGDCPLPLARVALQGRVLTIGAGDLELTAGEQQRLLRETFRLRLPQRERAEWSRALGGWAAGWILAAQKRRETALPLLPASGGGGATATQVFAFLAEDVLAALPERLQRAVLRVSLIEDLDEDAVRLLLGADAGRRFLEEIVRRGLLLRTLQDAGGAQRFHPLFRSFLRERFDATTPPRERTALLHRFARLLTRRGQTERAIRVLADAGNGEACVDLFERVAAALPFAEAPFDALALDLLVDPQVAAAAAQSPWILIGAARAQRKGADSESSLRRTRAATDLFFDRHDLEGLTRAVRAEARLSWATGRVVEARERMESFLRRLPARARRARGLILQEVADLDLQAGRPAEARRTVLKAESMLRGKARPEERAEIRLAMARIAFTEGRWDRYLTDAGRALALYRQIGFFARVQGLLINMGEACTYLGEEDRAIALLDEAALLHERTQLPANIVLASLGRGRACSEKGDARAAEGHFAATREHLRGRDFPLLALQLDVWEGLHHRRMGRMRSARELLERATQGFERQAVPSWLNVARMERALLAGLDGQTEPALRELRETAGISHRLGDEKEVARNLLYQARVAQHARRPHGDQLRRALSILETEDYLVLLRKIPDVSGPLFADGAPSLSAERRERALAALPEALRPGTRQAARGTIARARETRRSQGPAIRLSINMLGGLTILVSDQPVGFPRRAAETLLAYLALRPGKPVPIETLADALWPEAPPGAGRNRFDVTLNAARRALEPAAGARGPFRWLRTDSGWCRLEAEGTDVDVAQFERRARACQPILSRLGREEELRAEARDLTLLREALEVYAGDLLPALRDADWAMGERERLRELAMRLRLALGRASVSLRRTGEAEEAAAWILAIDPLHEEAHRLRLRALAMRKDRAGLVRAHEVFAREVARELDTSPAPETIALFRELLRRLDSPTVAR
jgi:ATP/maltotriose-dependent transcriptional regulator MalT/DNA-binding SARP family transcriptional activator